MPKYFEPIIAKVLDDCSKNIEEVKSAKQLFLHLAGTIPEDHPYYEQHMAFFVNWLLFSRRLSTSEFTPLRSFFLRLTSTDPAEEHEALRALSLAKLSLYQVSKIKSDYFEVREMLEGVSIPLAKGPMENFLSKGQFFCGYLATPPGADRAELLDGACIHPIEVTKIIEKTVKEYSPEHYETDLLKLSALKVKSLLFARFDVEKIYKDAIPFM